MPLALTTRSMVVAEAGAADVTTARSGIAIAGDELTCSGTVAKAEEGVVECELEERNQKGELCASGWARVDLPRRG